MRFISNMSFTSLSVSTVLSPGFKDRYRFQEYGISNTHAAAAAMRFCYHAPRIKNRISPAQSYKPETLSNGKNDEDSRRLRADAAHLGALLDDPVTISNVTVTKVSEN